MSTCKRVTGFWVIAMMALVGCSSPPYSADRLEGGSSGKSKGSGGEGDDEFEEQAPLEDSSESSGGAPSQGPASNGPCSSSTTSNSCLDCCETRAPNAITAVNDSLKNCLCTSPGSCASECGSSFCQGFEADAACATCMNGGAADKCMDTALSACEKNTSCAPFLECATKSGCEKKPAQ
jgi:hypothetical protein